MKNKELIQLLMTLDPEYYVEFLCPDGFQDDIENSFSIEDGKIVFKSYIHRKSN